MGWNSWDCYGAGVWESNVTANAGYMEKHLKPHGWNLITIDIDINTNNQAAWVADVPGSKDKYLALFNLSPAPPPGRNRRGPQSAVVMADPSAGAGAAATNSAPPPAQPDSARTGPVVISVPLVDLGIKGPVRVRDLWLQKDLGGVNEAVFATVNSHGAVLLRVQPVP